MKPVPIPDVYRADVNQTDPDIGDEALAVLEQPVTATIGTLNADGSIHLARVWFLFDQEHLYVECSSASRKAVNIAARARVSILVEAAVPAGATRWVSATGSGSLVRGDEASRISRRLMAKYLDGAGADAAFRYFSTIDDVCVDVLAERWMSWSDARLGARMQEAGVI